MADGVNKIILVGNLGKDPEVSYTQSGTARCRFSLATGESYKNSSGERVDKTEWHNVIVWGKQGENVGKFLSKGRQVYIEGKITTRSWDDQKTGEKKYMTEINAQSVMFLGGRGDTGSQGGGQDRQRGETEQGNSQDNKSGGYDSVSDESDIPF